MDSSKSNFRCIVCDVETSSLCNLHKHQTLRHTSEELSLSLLTLQSFIYHKHYFETLDSQIFREKCYFYPFCTQLLSTKNDNAGVNSQQFSHEATQVALKTEPEVTIVSTVIKVPERCEKIPKKSTSLRRPQTVDNLSTYSKNPETSPVTQSASVNCANSDKSDTDVAFLNSARALCDDLMKLKNKTKVKRKRLTEKRERPDKVSENGKQIVRKHQRKVKIDKDAEDSKTVTPILKSEDTEVLKIWAAKENEGAPPTVNNSATDTTETVQQIKLQSPGIPADMINAESALIFNPEIGTFQWNPLNCVERKSEENVDVHQTSVPFDELTEIAKFY